MLKPYNSDNSFLEEFLEEDSIPFRYYKFFEYKGLKPQDMLSAYYKRSSELMREYVKYVEKIEDEVQQFCLDNQYPQEFKLWFDNTLVFLSDVEEYM